MEAPSKMIFITGGVRSGKSSFAERIAIQHAIASNGKLHYIATGVPTDIEMEQRIRKHQEQRSRSEQKWKIWEQPMNVGLLAERFSRNDILLLDCLTTLLNNELFSTSAYGHLDQVRSISEGIAMLRERCHMLIIVSNEVLNEPIQDNELVLTYKKMLGTLHQDIVSKANQAFLVESGVPLLMKGEIR